MTRTMWPPISPTALPTARKWKFATSGANAPVTVIGDVPYGHKIAVRDIRKGELIIKYGEEIGIATHDIRRGEYVHIHNLDSLRGRGDL